MKIRLLFLITLFISTQLIGQTTYVPDDNFEQALIDLGLDDVLDDSVLTENIEDVTELTLIMMDISDLTGIEDFTALTSLICAGNDINELDVSSNTALTILNFSANPINDIDLSANTLIVDLGFFGTGLEYIDVSNMPNLKILNCSGNSLTELNVSDCPLLEIVWCGGNQFTHLDFSNNPELSYLDCSDSNVLVYLSVKNGNNESIMTFKSTFCPRLGCIEVDDPAYSEANWMDKDPIASFNENCGLGIENKVTPLIEFYPNPITDYLYINTDTWGVEFKLYGISGQVLQQGKLIHQTNIIELNKMPTGIYFLKIESGTYVVTHKIVKK